MAGSLSKQRHSDRGQDIGHGADRHEEIVHLSDSELVVSPQLLEQYLTVERKRNFRALCWLSSIFLFVILAVAALLLSIGVVVLRSSEEAVTVSRDLREETDRALAGYENKIVGVASDVKETDADLKTLTSQVRAEKASLYSNLERFSRYYDTKHSGLRTMVAGTDDLKEKMKSVEEAEAARAARFEEMEQWYREHQSAVPAGVAEPVATEGAVQAHSGVASLSSIIFGDEEVKALDAAATRPSVSADVDASGEERTVVYSNGSKYEGPMKDGKKHGYGIFSFVNGDSYVGEFKDDLRDGVGIYVYKSGARYDGGFKNGKRHGTGRYVYPNGDKFEGEFRNGMKSGRGVYTYSNNGAVIKGYWKDNDPLIMD